jgi:hypothetical protein
MTDAVSNIGASSSGTVVRPVTAPAAVAQQATTATLKTPELSPISPTFKSDPISGTLITEYISTSGSVETQFPSTAALNYLRQGLTATGERKDPTQLV